MLENRLARDQLKKECATIQSMLTRSKILFLLTTDYNHGRIRGKCARRLYTHLPDGMYYRP